MRVKLIVAYDGTNYCGWQIQDNGVTIEEILNKELSNLLKEDIHVIGASRTDSGVHALGNVAVFDTETRIPAEKISFALNQRLPDDIRIQNSCQVKDDFHPRFCDTIKTYEYKIWNNRFPNPVVRLYSKFVYYNLDIEKMEKAAQYLIGEHDFKSFTKANSEIDDYVRTIFKTSVSKNEDIIKISIEGSGFLRYMVRNIVGLLIEIGEGKKNIKDVSTILEAKDRTESSPTAPACGLYLNKINY